LVVGSVVERDIECIMVDRESTYLSQKDNPLVDILTMQSAQECKWCEVEHSNTSPCDMNKRGI